jgi:hypothetical protein
MVNRYLLITFSLYSMRYRTIEHLIDAENMNLSENLSLLKRFLGIVLTVRTTIYITQHSNVCVFVHDQLKC